MSKPIAVLITDIHFTPHTLEEASQSFLKAQFKAKMLKVPLIVCGDTLDSKAIMRAECVNKLIDLVSVKDAPEMIFLVGNHDKINEKSDEHTLNFLKPYAVVVDRPIQGHLGKHECLIIPYQNDINVIKDMLLDDTFPQPKLIIMHQGVFGTKAGHYMQDKTACPSEWFDGYTTISGHYHERQNVKCGKTGGLYYLGNPYTGYFSEANTEKGYHVLNDDLSLEFISLGLREHRIMDITVEQLRGEAVFLGEDKDILWVKIRGTAEELAGVSKKYVAQELDINQDFKLELIPSDIKTDSKFIVNRKLSTAQIFDNMIDSLTNTSDERKKRLKAVWKGIVE